MNISKTLAVRHQESISLNEFNGKSVINESKTLNHIDLDILKDFDKTSEIDNSIFVYKLNFLHVNSYQYREGIILIENFLLFEIVHVLKQNDQYFFACKQLDLIEYHESYNSIEISTNTSNSNLKLLWLDQLHNKTSYQKNFSKGKTFIVCETLDVFNNF